MWSRTRASPVAVGGVALALLLAACGSQSSIKGALSQDANSSISAELSSVGDAVSSRSCGSASSALAKLDATLTGLPASTNASLVANLRQGAATLRGLALTECHGTRTTTSSSTSSTSTSSSTTSTPTVTTTTTAPPTTSTTVTTSTSSNLPGTGTVTTFGTSTGSGAGGGSGGAGTLGGGQ